MKPTSVEELAWKAQVEAFRESKKPELKKALPAFCPGALLRSREAQLPLDERIEELTGWMQFDIDAKDNPHIENAADLRDAISHITFTAFCSLSTSGNGVWGLIKVADVHHYRDYFEQLKLDYQSLGITLDPSKGGNPTDLRFYTYDPNAYIASELRIYDRRVISTQKHRHEGFSSNQPGDAWESVSKAIAQINMYDLDIAPDYDSYVKLGFSLAHEFGEGGRQLFHMACRPSPKYNSSDADKQYSKCLRSNGSGITLGTFFHLYKTVKG